MTNKPLSKLLSVILTIAICTTTVFGCLITVNALDTPGYVITGAECITGQTVASAMVEFSASDGIAGGNFIIANEDGWYSSVEASFIGVPNDATDQIIVETNMRDNQATVLFYITDENGTAKQYTAISLKLDFVFAEGGIANDIQITISDLELTDRFEDPYTNVSNNSTYPYFTAGCQHSFVVSDKKVYASEELGYTLYSGAVCQKCGETSADYQVVPEVKLSDQVSVYTASFITDISALEGSGTESEPYIIKTADQFASVALGKVTNYAAGSYFKVADGIKSFYMNGGETLANMTTAADVKAYFEEYGGYGWASSWDRYTAGKSFCGHFDGSGVTIYGLYDDVNDGTDGLFEAVEGTTTLSNFTLKNSYFAANSGAGVAPILTRTSSASDTADTVTIEKVSVVNNYIAQTGDRAQGACAIAGYLYSGDKININNCIIYGNNIDNSKYTGSALNTGLICFVNDGNTAGSVQINNIISLGVIPVTSNGGSYYRALSGSITNIYTDMDCSTVVGSTYTDANKTKYNFNDNIALSDLQGAKAEITADALDWNTDENTDGVWFTGNAGQYPSLLKKNILPVADATNSAWKLLGVNIVYANDGSFALNFHYEPSYDSDAKLYVANAESESKSQILTEAVTSSFAGDILPESAKMFTLDNLSARDIQKLWVATVVTTSADGGEIVYGKSEQISIGDYAEDVVLGNAFYDEDATDAEKAADKNVAAALINYGLASNSALSITDIESTTATIVEKWDKVSDGVAGDDWYDSTYEAGDGTKDNPYIISSAEELANLCCYGCDAGVYYKVDDSIKAFDMNTVSGVDLTVDNITASQVKDAVADKILGKVWFCDAPFKGNFDGNGVTIYGLCTGPAYYNQSSFESGSKAGYSRGGLFGQIDASTAVIKNISIKNSYFKGDPAGAVFGETLGNGGSATIENIVVSNCYVDSSGDNVSGVIGGYCLYDAATNTADKVKLNNCLVYDNIVYNKAGTAARLIGTMEAYCDNGSGTKVRDYDGFGVSNTIAIGCNIENSGSYWQKDSKFFINCYTTETPATENTTITKLFSVDDAKGIAAKTNMSDLDWETVWLCGTEGEYPSIVLTAGKVNPVSEYSGTPDTTSTLAGSGTAEDPYIIETADQFAAIALGKRTSTEDTYYKVKDGVKSFYMQGGDAVADMTSVEQVKAYFEQNSTPTSSTWTKTNTFTGQFDGNGVTIYGLYCYNIGQYVYSGLFPQVTGHSSIKNITLKNSYISSDCGDGLGAIVGATVWVSGGADENSVEFENIAVINNYICQRRATASGASAIGGNFFNSNYATVNNAIVYGNIIDNSAYTGTGLLSGLFTANGGINSSRSDDAEIQNVIALGVTPWLLKQTGDNTYSHTNWNLANVSSGVYKNIYTDQSVAALQTYNSSNNSDANLSKYNINVVSPSSLQGENAVSTTASAGFDWNTTWFAGAYNNYPSLTPVSTMPVNTQALYDGMVLDNYDSFGKSTDKLGVDSTTLVLKANPYMSFIFALNDYRKYKGDGDKVTINFSDSNGNTLKSITANDMINSESNGRYHKYYLRDIPVISLATGITVTAIANGETYNLGTYGAEGFALAVARANRLNPCDYYLTRYEAAKALVFYTKMLDARYGGNQ